MTGSVGAGRRRPIRCRPSTPALITTFILLTAFANGCTALTGVEAVADGVPMFKEPPAKNAARTLVMMAVLGVTMFVGLTLLAHAYQIVPSETETVVSQLARGVFGGRNLFYFAVQARDDADPDPRGQHRVRRLPDAGVDRRARSLHAAAVRQPRRQAVVLERHRRAEPRRGDADHRVRRRSAPPDPALHDRRVPVVHAVAVEHVPADDAAAGKPGWQHQRRDQRLRRGADRPGPDHRHDDQDARRRLDRDRADSRPGDDLQADADALRERGRRSCRSPMSKSTRRRTATS